MTAESDDETESYDENEARKRPGVERVYRHDQIAVIDIETIKGFFSRYLGCDPYAEITVADWLTFSENKLLAVTSGKVFYELKELYA